MWGKFESKDELKKFGFLAITFFLIIGVYWTMRPIKDSLFFAIIGGEYLWRAKIISLLVISPLVILYGKLIDTFERHKVFYALISIYTLITLGFMWAFMHPEIGLANMTKDPARLIGWAWYVFVESFGSLIVALFWAFTTDTTKTDSAKRGFPIIALFGQLGNILGPAFITAKFLGFASSAPIVGICAGLMALTGGVFWIFMRVTPKEQLTGYEAAVKAGEKAEEPGFLDGLKLLFSESYLFGMFLLISVYEIIITIFDYHFKQGVYAAFPAEVDAAAYLGSYGSYVGIVATLCVLLGINNIQRVLGMTASLILLPILVSGAVFAIYTYPSAINVAFWIMVFSKAVNYALNQPTMKQLYIPTTPETKYKAQAWLEMFGSRGSKAGGSLINSLRNVLGVNLFISIFAFASVGCIGFWIFIALYVAKTYNQAIKENKVVC